MSNNLIDNIGTGNVSYSMEVWIYVHKQPLGTDVSSGETIMGHNGNNGIGLQIISDGETGFILNCGNRNNSNFNSEPLALNKWYHCVLSRDSLSETATLYVDGSVNSSGSNLAVNNTEDTFQIGRSARTSKDYNGYIGYVSVYNKALTEQEVLNNYLSLRYRFDNAINV